MTEHTTMCRLRWRHCLRCTCDPVKRADTAIREALREPEDHRDCVAGWLTAVTLSLFIGAMLYGCVVIESMAR